MRFNWIFFCTVEKKRFCEEREGDSKRIFLRSTEPNQLGVKSVCMCDCVMGNGGFV